MAGNNDNIETLIKVAVDHCAGYLKHGIDPMEFDGASALVPVSEDRLRIFKDALTRMLKDNHRRGIALTLFDEPYGILHDATNEARVMPNYPVNFRITIQPAQGTVVKFGHRGKREILYRSNGDISEMQGRSA